MKTTRTVSLGAAIGVAALLASLQGALNAGQPTQRVPIDNDDIGGVVTSATGPEAGVWVIAETTDLPTKFVKIVVTDESGRYVLPDLPKANFTVWVRGYGLVDSLKVKATPGTILNLTAVVASNARAAAEYYPAGFWFSMIRVPEKSDFPGNAPGGNGIAPTVKSQADWIQRLKSGGCTACHQLGTKGTREIPKALGTFHSSVAAWDRRIQSGQAGAQMSGGLNAMGRDRALQMFADWTDRIAGGELPPAPPRPTGMERNVVITQWDWADPKAYLHDEVSTDRRNPTINANGLIYGSLELSADYLPVLDPVHSTISQVKLTVRDPNTPPTSATMPEPSPYWGEEPIWTSRNNVHNPMFDEKGRVWITSAVRPSANPDFCKDGSSHPSAKLYPLANAGRHLAVYDPKTKQLTHISTCFGTHHLMFAMDANRTLWTSGGGQVVGWLNTKMFDETHDEAKSQGWTALVMDTNGNGKRDAYVEPNQPLDPTKDKRFGSAFYAVAPAPDGSIWGSVLGFPGAVVRLNPGSNPPETALAEVYEPPHARLLAARRRCGSQWCLLDGARERTHGELRPTQMQGAAQRTEGDRPALPGRLDALSRAVAATEGRHGSRQRRGELLHLGRLARYSRARRERTDRHRQRVRRSPRAERRQVDRAARPVSDRVLHEVDGWPHRRCEGRLEGQGALGDREHSHAVSHGNREGDDEQGDALPAASRSACEMSFRSEPDRALQQPLRVSSIDLCPLGQYG